jgi:catechol 2,3-dioxygenase-like lactoylglutathione lyase family enzyme
MQRAIGRSIALVALVVRDYDEAITFFTDALRFTLVEDTPLAAGKRWVVVAPPVVDGAVQGAALLLARAATPDQLAHVGDQTGGRVFLFLHTDDFWRDYEAMQARGVRFAEAPRREAYGLVVVFYDLYGNKWDLIQPVEAGAPLP